MSAPDGAVVVPRGASPGGRQLSNRCGPPRLSRYGDADGGAVRYAGLPSRRGDCPHAAGRPPWRRVRCGLVGLCASCGKLGRAESAHAICFAVHRHRGQPGKVSSPGDRGAAAVGTQQRTKITYATYNCRAGSSPCGRGRALARERGPRNAYPRKTEPLAHHCAARRAGDTTECQEHLEGCFIGSAGSLSNDRSLPVPNRWACDPWGSQRPHPPWQSPTRPDHRACRRPVDSPIRLCESRHFSDRSHRE